jgi:hypothetical protein
LCQSKHYMFTTKRHVPIRIKIIWNNPWHFTLPTPIQVIFIFVHSFNLLCLIPFLLLVASNCIFLPLLLICPIYTTNLYFTMARGKLPPIFTPNTLESMIKYTLISSILDRICEMITTPWEYPRDDTRLLPLHHLLYFRT